jgi:hypothetical protein
MGNLSNLFSIILFNHATRLTKPLTEIHVPPTVHGILASRIDALPASEKGLLANAALIGISIRHLQSPADSRCAVSGIARNG